MSSREIHAVDRNPGRQHRLGEFLLDLERGFLRHGVDEVPLRAKTFEVLKYLVERHGRLVTKTELIDAVWPDAAVTDNSLAQCIAEIRRALHDDEQQVVRTVARRGYVIAAPAIVSPATFARPAGDVLDAPASSAAASIDTPESAHTSAAAHIAPTAHTPATADAGAVARAGGSRPASTVRRWTIAGASVAILVIGAAGFFALRSYNRSRTDLTYTQLTDFTDSAVAPAVSPDGRLLAFIRGDKWFGASDQIYVKMLPSGEAIQLTHDPRPKYSVAFSPDGSQIAYTAFGTRAGWETFTTSPLGGEPRLLVANAAGLTWLDDQHLLFSEIKSGMHMGIVTATPDRSQHHDVYFPSHQRAMAHYSHASPDRRWALVIEMDHQPIWQPCRVVPLDGSSAGRQVGPRGFCTGAGWSPDGSWMYFTAAVDEKHHVWRQRFPDGQPEQLTFGPSEEDGIAIGEDGSLITSIGMEHSAIWMHDRDGDHPLSSEGSVVMRIGTASLPSFSADARSIYYLRESAGSRRELWRADVKSGRNEPVLPGTAMGEYDISPDGQEVVFSTSQEAGPSQLWIAALDRKGPPRLIASAGENAPRFGRDGQVLFRFSDRNFNYLGRMNKDGSGRATVVPYPISTFQNISPDRRWLVAITPVLDAPQSSAPNAPQTAASMAVPTGGGPPRRICGVGKVCPAAWSPDGKFLYVSTELSSRTSPGRTVAIPVAPGTGLPELPEAGIVSTEEALSIPGSRVVEQSDLIPGLDPATYAYIKRTVHRNLFRIHLS